MNFKTSNFENIKVPVSSITRHITKPSWLKNSTREKNKNRYKLCFIPITKRRVWLPPTLWFTGTWAIPANHLLQSKPTTNWYCLISFVTYRCQPHDFKPHLLRRGFQTLVRNVSLPLQSTCDILIKSFGEPTLLRVKRPHWHIAWWLALISFVKVQAHR